MHDHAESPGDPAIRENTGTRSREEHRIGPARMLAGAGAVLALLLLVRMLHVQEHLLTLVTWVQGSGWPGVAVFVLMRVARRALSATLDGGPARG